MSEVSYADAAGLVERSAAAYVAAVPVDPADDGFFGPASVTWRVYADLSAPVAGLRSLMIQALHPLAMAGVDQHSGWRLDPVGRLAATSAYEAAVTYGDRASASRAAQRVRAIHSHVRGVDTVTGREYAASDPALLLWVQLDQQHAAAIAEHLPTPLEPLDPGLGRGQPTVVRQSPIRLDRHLEPLGELVAPSGERRILGPAIETRVQLDSVEDLDVAGQPSRGRQARRVQHIRPVVVGPSRGADPTGQAATRRSTSSSSATRTRAAASRELSRGASAPSLSGCAGRPSRFAAAVARSSK